MRAIDLHWLWERDKWLPLPDLVYRQDGSGSGVYYPPDPSPFFLEDGNTIAGLNGIICVSPDHNDTEEAVANTLAHEWRHHWQWHSGKPWTPQRWAQCSADEYLGNIAAYYLRSRMEMDALLFSVRAAPSELSSEWVDAISARLQGYQKTT